MKYTVDIKIEKPRNELVKLYDNPENLYKWMDGLVKIEAQSGIQGEIGAKSQLYFKIGDREMDMLETIVEKDLPNKIIATYEAKGVFNTVEVRFEELPEGKTRYINIQDFQFSGIMKVLSLFMKSAFKKQSVKNLKDFKNFAESQSQ